MHLWHAAKRGLRPHQTEKREAPTGLIGRHPMQKAVRDALIGFMAAAAQAHAEVTKAAQLAGIAHAKSLPDGKRYKGRKPSYTESQLNEVLNLFDQKAGVSVISKVTGLSRQAVYRIVADPVAARASLVEGGPVRD